MSRVLVYQANGVQGAATVRRVQQAGYATRALIRDRSRADALRDCGIEVAVADLADHEALLRAHDSVDYAIVQIPATTDGFVATAIDNAIHAMAAARVKGAIIKMANPAPSTHVPDSGFSVNAIISRAFVASGIPHSIIEPTMYLNTFLKPSLRHEISVERRMDFPISSGLKVAWTTVEDAARLAVQLLQSHAYGHTFRCAGVAAFNGNELAAAFSKVLGRNIEFRSTPLEQFRREIEAAIGAKAAFPAISKFRFLADHPEEASHMLGTAPAGSAAPGEFKPAAVDDWIADNQECFIA